MVQSSDDLDFELEAKGFEHSVIGMAQFSNADIAHVSVNDVAMAVAIRNELIP